jgi:hypothetical protein
VPPVEAASERLSKPWRAVRTNARQRICAPSAYLDTTCESVGPIRANRWPAAVKTAYAVRAFSQNQ